MVGDETKTLEDLTFLMLRIFVTSRGNVVVMLDWPLTDDFELMRIQQSLEEEVMDDDEVLPAINDALTRAAQNTQRRRI